MTLEEALKTAMKYETRIRDLYIESAENTADPSGKQLFQSLADDEANHLSYLESRLAEWRKHGKITLAALKSALPSAAAIVGNIKPLQERMAAEDRKDEKQMLSKALHLEIETSRFYATLVEELPGDGRELFSRFLAIEKEHADIVQAQLDYLSHTGYWFDTKEFDME